MVSAIQLFIANHPVGFLALGGLVVGMLFGWTVTRTNFCVMGALSDVRNLDDGRRLRAWVLAAVVALLATQALRLGGGVPLERALYLAPRLNWIGHVVGGLIFGFGMVLTGGCPTRNLVRFGSGDLRALVVLLVTAVAGYVTIGGLFAPVRDVLEQATAIDLTRFGLTTQSVGAILAKTGVAAEAFLDRAVAVTLAGAGFWFALSDRAFRASRLHVVSGVVIGLLIASGWLATGLAVDDLAATTMSPTSLSFIRPLGDTLEWLQRFTAIPWPGFGVASVLGTLLGAHLAARVAGRVRLLGFANLADLKANLAGAIMMGTGGAMALGCTIGQGLSGVSTLALGSFLTVAALVYGGLLGLSYLERSADV